MANERNNIRVMTAVSPELNEKLNALCKAYGMSKSGLVAYYVGKMVDTETRVQNLVNSESMNNLMKSLLLKGELPEITLPDGTSLTRESDKC